MKVKRTSFRWSWIQVVKHCHQEPVSLPPWLCSPQTDLILVVAERAISSRGLTFSRLNTSASKRMPLSQRFSTSPQANSPLSALVLCPPWINHCGQGCGM